MVKFKFKKVQNVISIENKNEKNILPITLINFREKTSLTTVKMSVLISDYQKRIQESWHI